ncbi:MAG: SurA N-terminal domain-containing protein, partial [Deltaproteobacteria bacterium]
MKLKWSRPVLLAMAVLFVFGSMIPARAGEEQSPDEKVAVVNGAIITKAELEQELQVVLNRFGRVGKMIQGPQLAQLKPKVLESLIGRELLFQEAQGAGIRIKEETVSDQLEKLKKRFSSEAAFRE